MPTFHPPEWYLSEANKIGDEYNNRMLGLANRFKRDIIIPLCKRHGLIQFSVGRAMGGPLSVMFGAPTGTVYGQDFNGTLCVFGLQGPQPLEPGPFRDDLEKVYRVIRNAELIEHLTSVNVPLERE